MPDVPDAVVQWCERFARAAGVDPPTDQEIDDLLSLAGIAAHASARQAAPITCWLAARGGMTLESALAAARSLAGEEKA
jgi:hypothetical protein